MSDKAPEPATECMEYRQVTDGSIRKPGLLACCLVAGHEGLHYDEHDDVSWKAGQP